MTRQGVRVIPWRRIAGAYLSGIAEFIREHGAWLAYHEPRDVAQEPAAEESSLARFTSHDAEEALNEAVGKFSRRFRALEARMRDQGRSFTDCTLDEMEAGWQAVKRDAAGPPS